MTGKVARSPDATSVGTTGMPEAQRSRLWLPQNLAVCFYCQGWSGARWGMSDECCGYSEHYHRGGC
jgi:hypothetical protein